MVTEAEQSADRRAWTEAGDPVTIDCPACTQPAGQDCIDDWGEGPRRPPEPHLARSIRLLTDRLRYLHGTILAGRDDTSDTTTKRMADARA